MSRLEPLTEEESQRMKDHDHLARLMAIKMRRYFPPLFSLDDIVSVGRLGLAEATLKWTPDGAAFRSFAYFRIRGAILDELRSLNHVRHARAWKQRESAVAELEQRLLRHPDADEVARHMHIPLARYHRIVQPVEQDHTQDPERFVDTASDVLSAMIAQERREILADAIHNLPERQRVVLTLYAYEDYSNQEIARMLNISTDQVMRIKEFARRRLKRSIATAMKATRSVGA